MVNSLTISPVLNQQLSIKAAMEELRYIRDNTDQHDNPSVYDAAVLALNHLEDALKLCSTP